MASPTVTHFGSAGSGSPFARSSGIGALCASTCVPRTVSSNSVPVAGLRAINQASSPGGFSFSSVSSARNVRRSSSVTGRSRPPPSLNRDTSLAVTGPLGHFELRRITRFRVPSGRSPDSRRALRSLVCAAMAFGCAIARNDQCASASVSSSSVRRSRACSSGDLAPNGGSTFHSTPLPSCSTIHAVSAAITSSRMIRSSCAESSAERTSESCLSSANCRSIGERSRCAGTMSSSFSDLVSRPSNSDALPVCRQYRTCASTRCSNARGVNRFSIPHHTSGSPESRK